MLSEGNPRSRRTGRPWSAECPVHHILLFFSLAVSQPLYAVLAENAEFLLAHSLSGLDLVLFTAFLSVVAPVVLVLSAAPLRGLGRRPFALARLSILTALTLLLVLPLIDLLGMGSVTSIGAGLLATAALSALYVRSTAYRRFLTYFSPAVLVFPVLFFFASPVRVLLRPQAGSPEKTSFEIRTDDVPVFVIVFDELSTVLIADEDRMIDEDNYPNLARMAESSLWFRNSFANCAPTELAIPTILTGRFPDRDRLPVFDSHPVNLFTLFAPEYDVVAHESLTRLCPDEICGERETLFDLDSFLADLAIVYAHIATPAGSRHRLPPLHGKWSGFSVDETPTVSAEALSSEVAPGDFGWYARLGFEDFVASIDQHARGKLHYFHSLLPHLPYVFLPDGRIYTRYEGMDNLPGWTPARNLWGENQALVEQGYQRALLQTQFVDRLVGLFLDRLQETGVFRDSLIVLTADHGVNFLANRHRRGFRQDTLATGLMTPLFLKLPGQDRGQISDRSVQAIDILPTLLSVVGDFDQDVFDGVSVLTTEDDHDRPVTVLPFAGEAYDLPADMTSRFAAEARRKYSIFRRVGGRLDHYHLARYSGYIGRLASELTIGPPLGARVTLDESEALLEVDPESNFVPSFFQGRIDDSEEHARFERLAIVLGGRVVAVAPVYELNGQTRFSAMIPPQHFEPGANLPSFFVLSQRDGAIEFRQLSSATTVAKRQARTDRGRADAPSLGVRGTLKPGRPAMKKASPAEAGLAESSVEEELLLPFATGLERLQAGRQGVDGALLLQGVERQLLDLLE